MYSLGVLLVPQTVRLTPSPTLDQPPSHLLPLRIPDRNLGFPDRFSALSEKEGRFFHFFSKLQKRQPSAWHTPVQDGGLGQDGKAGPMCQALEWGSARQS